MVKKLLIPLLLFVFSFANAETIKTDVLVIGNGPGAMAAALQCAHSKVKTILADENLKLTEGANKEVTVETNNKLPSGAWGEFRRRVREFYSKTPGYDTTQNAPLKFEPATAISILKKTIDTTKNLTEYADTKFVTIKKDGDKWEVSLTQNGKAITVKTRVVIDATDDAIVAAKAGAKIYTGFDKDISASNLYRTSIAVSDGTTEKIPHFMPMQAILVKGADNILCTEKAFSGDKTIQHLPLQLEIGQGAGAVAAFCAFFKTTTQHLSVRIIQGELLDFKGYLVPFTDIKQTDHAWRAIQQVSATGLLKGIQKANGHVSELNFEPGNIINTDEIKPVLMEMYTRAFLWFDKEKPGEKFTLGNLLSLISDYTLTDPKTLQIALQRNWTNQLKLSGSFDPNRPATRLEFAVLANRYLNPFAKTVDMSGRMVN